MDEKELKSLLKEKLKSIERWKLTRGFRGKRNVLVIPKVALRDVHELLKGDDKVAYISIEATPACAKYWLEDEKGYTDNDHVLESSPTVFNTEFDDIERDTLYKGHVFKTISQDQADEMVDFIENNLDKDIIVHCKAGRSRSQGVARFILDMYPDYYQECFINQENPCDSPNMEVVRKLKRSYYKKHGLWR